MMTIAIDENGYIQEKARTRILNVFGILFFLFLHLLNRSVNEVSL